MNASPLCDLVGDALDRAENGIGRLPGSLIVLPGMSGRKYRLFINNLIADMDRPNYLEVGCCAGSTFCSAIYANSVRALAVDNWSEFDGPRSEFFNNVSRFAGEKASVSVITSDFREVDYRQFGPFNVYLFDGPHEQQDQYDGLKIPFDALAEEFVFIVDDWNWKRVRDGTLAAIRDIGLQIVGGREIRTTLNDLHPPRHLSFETSDWHNGYFIAVLQKRAA